MLLLETVPKLFRDHRNNYLESRMQFPDMSPSRFHTIHVYNGCFNSGPAFFKVYVLRFLKGALKDPAFELPTHVPLPSN